MAVRLRGAKGKVARRSLSSRAGLIFPVARIQRYLRKGRYAKRIGKGAAVYMAAALEYLASELCELAGLRANEEPNKRITPRHIMLAVRNDDQLDKLLPKVTFPGSGAMPVICAGLIRAGIDDVEENFSIYH